MPSFLFHLQVKPECQNQVLQTLTVIQRAAQQDEGCLSFTWFRHKNDSNRFTMHERWASDDALNAHKAKGVEIWEAFVPCLAAEPVLEELEQVGEILCDQLADSTIGQFVNEWYDKLSKRAPLVELTSMIAGIGLDMRFPDAQIRSHTEFSQWYTKVGQKFDEQRHIVESITTLPSENGLLVFICAVWKVRQKADGQRLAMRTNQTWTIGRCGTNGQPVILTYHVNSLEKIAKSQDPAAPVRPASTLATQANVCAAYV